MTRRRGSSLLAINKPNMLVRICAEPKPQKKALVRSHCRIPTIEDVLPKLTGAEIFSTVDAKDGFWHRRPDEPSRRLTAFETPFGRYRWQGLPFRLNVGP